MLAAAAARSGSAAAVAAVVVAALPVRLRVAVGPAHLAHKRLAVVRLRLLHLLRLPLPQVVVESEVPLHLPGRPSCSAAMARSSPPTVPPTYERAPSTRSPPNGRPWPSAWLDWMPVRG